MSHFPAYLLTHPTIVTPLEAQEKKASSAPKRSVLYNPSDIDLEYDVSYDPVPTNPFQAVAAAARNKNSHHLEDAYEYGDKYVGCALLIICSSLEESLPDLRLYKLYIKRASRSKL
jgi:hypothetical protein